MTERWYNRILAGRWKFSELSGLGEQMISFRSQIVEGLSARWLPATLVTLLSQTIFFVMLVMSMRFVGVTSEQAGWEIIFDAYAVGLLLSLIPILPAGLGVVEVAYVGIIAGESGTDLANAVMAGAFVHRIFTWFVPDPDRLHSPGGLAEADEARCRRGRERLTAAWDSASRVRRLRHRHAVGGEVVAAHLEVVAIQEDVISGAHEIPGSRKEHHRCNDGGLVRVWQLQELGIDGRDQDPGDEGKAHDRDEDRPKANRICAGCVLCPGVDDPR